MRRELMNEVTPMPSIAPAVVTDNTAQVGAIIDSAGYRSLTYLIQTGTLADAGATFTALLEEGNDAALADAAAVDDSNLIGLEATASFDQAADGKCFKLGYKGLKRYTRLTITPAGNASNAPLSAMALLGHPVIAPTANPPA